MRYGCLQVDARVGAQLVAEKIDLRPHRSIDIYIGTRRSALTGLPISWQSWYVEQGQRMVL